MLTLWGEKQAFCDGLTRRNFLKIGAFGAGLSLAEMLRLRAHASSKTAGSPSPKSAIMIYLPGGPSHLDMYDLKPDAPKEFRGEFRPIATNVAGVQICEHFPRSEEHTSGLESRQYLECRLLLEHSTNPTHLWCRANAVGC